MHVQSFFLRHSNETLAYPITVGKFFFNKCVPIGPCVPTGTFTLPAVFNFPPQFMPKCEISDHCSVVTNVAG